MVIIEINALPNGAHRNQEGQNIIIPKGWVIVPDKFLSTWEKAKPFVTIEVKDNSIVKMEAMVNLNKSSEEIEEIDPLEERLSIIENAIIELTSVCYKNN